MRVNTYIIKKNDDNLSGDSINIGITQSPWLTDQDDTIQMDFVDKEVENTINPIFDYEKIKLIPKNNNGICNGLTYRLRLDIDNYSDTTYWSYVGFVYEDFKFFKNSFTKSYLRLDFFDTDNGLTQRLLSFTTLFPKFNVNDYVNINDEVPQPANYELSFVLGNTLIDRTQNGEGFFLYHYKDEIIPTVPKYLYMRATFFNAKNGTSTRLMSTNQNNLSIDELVKSTEDSTNKNNLYTRYKLTRETNGYFYEIDTTYSNNIINNGKITTVVLYKISSS